MPSGLARTNFQPWSKSWTRGAAATTVCAWDRSAPNAGPSARTQATAAATARILLRGVMDMVMDMALAACYSTLTNIKQQDRTATLSSALHHEAVNGPSTFAMLTA
jgi:hypothetical protein